MAEMVSQDPKTITLDSYSLSMEKFSPEDHALLQAIFTCVIDFMPAHDPSDELVYHWTQYVLLSSVQSHHAISLKSLYNLVDRGLVRFNDHFNTGQQVSLGTPLIFLQLNNIGRDSLTATEAIALRHPHGYLTPIAEQIAMKFLVEKAAKWIVPAGQAVKLKHKKCNVLTIIDDDKKDIKELSKITIDDLVDSFWKVTMDDLMDCLPHSYAVFHEATDDGSLFAHYIQLELGASRMMLDPVANKLLEKHHNDTKTITDRYAACQKPLKELKWYFVTTRQLGPEENKILGQGFNTIIDAARLKRDVWPDVVKNLGKPYK